MKSNIKNCPHCKKELKILRNSVDYGNSSIWNSHCLTCGSFINGGITPNTKINLIQGDDDNAENTA